MAGIFGGIFSGILGGILWISYGWHLASQRRVHPIASGGLLALRVAADAEIGRPGGKCDEDQHIDTYTHTQTHTYTLISLSLSLPIYLSLSLYIYIYIYISKFGGCKRQDSLS